MKILIIGRTASGKDALQDILSRNYGWTFVKSMTTRPRRTPNEDTHIFLTKEEAGKIPKSDHAAWTCINGYEYFSTRDQVYEADAYIIDPNGAEMLLKNMPEEWFRIIYLSPADEEIRAEMAIRRSDTPEKEIEIFKQRAAAEDPQFSAFEEKMKNGFSYPNCDQILQVTNDYAETTLENLAMKLEFSRRFERNMKVIIHDLIDADIMNHTNRDTAVFCTKEGKQATVGINTLIEVLEEDDALLGDMVHRWLQLAHVNLPVWQQSAETDTDDTSDQEENT